MAQKIFEIDDRDVLRYENHVKGLRERSFAYAIRNTLNDAAFGTMRRSKRRIQDDFTVRDKRYSVGGVTVRRARGLDVDRMFSATGHIRPEMAMQETGGVARSKDGKTKSIPSTSAAGQGIKTHRNKKVRKANFLSKIHTDTSRLRSKARKRTSSKKQEAFVMTLMAKREGKKFLFLDFRWTAKQGRGIFKIMGTKRRPKVRLMHSMKEKEVKVKSRPWLNPSAKDERVRIPFHFRKHVRKQIRLFK